MSDERPGPADPLTERWRPEDLAVLEALRDWTVGQAEMNHHLGRWAGLPTSDANALGHVVWAAEGGDPLSPQALSRRLGMTTGATTVLVDRLERAGMVVRSRESTDRRRVTLRPSDEGRERARAFTAFAGREMAATVQEASAEDLRVVADFLERLSGAVAAGNERLRQREG
jgi:DNA-binding MarR family transcriptional regulator